MRQFPGDTAAHNWALDWRLHKTVLPGTGTQPLASSVAAQSVHTRQLHTRQRLLFVIIHVGETPRGLISRPHKLILTISCKIANKTHANCRSGDHLAWDMCIHGSVICSS